MDYKKYAELCSKLESYRERERILKKEGLVGGECWRLVMIGYRACIKCIERMERELTHEFVEREVK